MEAKELRIGNWLHTNKPVMRNAAKDMAGGFVQVEEILSDGINLTNNDGAALYRWKDLQPVVLTPELLEKCGFEEHTEDAGYFIEIGRKTFLLGMDQGETYTVLLYQSDVGLPFVFLEYIEHLHHLQNVVYALTNTEIEITL